MKVFYHGADNDGKLSGAIVKLKYPDIQMCPITHGMEFPFHDIKFKERVYMCDYSLSPHEMKKLLTLSDFVWLDHHISAIRDCKKYNLKINGFRSIKNSACYWTWKYIFPNTPVPKIVQLVSDFDIWNISDNKYETIMNYALESYINEPNTDDGFFLWKELLLNCDKEILDKLYRIGNHIYRYNKIKNYKYAKNNCISFKFFGYNAVALNCNSNSLIFDDVYEELNNPEIMITFNMTKQGKWALSLYSKHDYVNCEQIAQKYGGGGHKSASGCICSELPFDIERK